MSRACLLKFRVSEREFVQIVEQKLRAGYVELAQYLRVTALQYHPSLEQRLERIELMLMEVMEHGRIARMDHKDGTNNGKS